ncbi:MAG: endonuclease/exonuclease/phosphatase family protein [Patescibacteria group bacterium]
MKLINLNIWTGKIHSPLIEFIKKHRNDTDIFCFQEVSKSNRNIITHDTHSNMIGELVELLPDFNYNFAPIGEGYDTKGPVDFQLLIGQATFVKKDLKIIDEGDIFVYRKLGDMGIPHPDGRPDFPRNFLYSEIEKEGKKFLVLNIHGFWEPKPKYDTPQRFTQSRMILDFISKYNCPKIIAGDLNLSMDTHSIKMLEEKLKNLVKEYGFTTTRSGLYDPYYRSHDKFADYIFVSRDFEIKDFKVLEDQVSDHLPLYLNFEA